MRLKRFLCSAFFLLTAATAFSAQNISLRDDEVLKLQKLIETDKSAAKQFNSLLKTADAALSAAPNPIETITTEGRLQGDPLKTTTTEALKDMPKIYALAVVYRVKTDEKYLKKTEEFLNAWAAKNRPSGDPIDETSLDNAFEAYDLVKSQLPAQSKTQIENWFRRIAEAEINFAKMKKGKMTSINNWNSHRLKIIGEIAWTINDENLKKHTLENLKTQIAANLNADGTSLDFLERDALHYHVYDLEPLLKLAIVLKRSTGTDFYNYQSEKGASIAKSIAFLAPYVSGEKTHPEFVNSKVAFDKARAQNGEKNFAGGTLFEPSKGNKAISLAAWFEPKLLENISKNNDQRFPNWQTVLNEVTK